jgi:uncharacterized membrane protein
VKNKMRNKKDIKVVLFIIAVALIFICFVYFCMYKFLILLGVSHEVAVVVVFVLAFLNIKIVRRK